MRDSRAWQRHNFGLATRLSAGFVDRHAPHGVGAGAVARKVEVSAFGRPRRAPVERRVTGDADSLSAGGGNRPDVALVPVAGDGPDAMRCPCGDHDGCTASSIVVSWRRSSVVVETIHSTLLRALAPGLVTIDSIP